MPHTHLPPTQPANSSTKPRPKQTWIIAATATALLTATITTACGTNDTNQPATPATTTPATTTTAAPTTTTATLHPEAVDAIYRDHLAHHTTGWDRIGSRLRGCITNPEDCATSIDTLVASVSRKAETTNDAFLAANEQAGGSQPSPEVDQSTTTLIMATILANQAAQKLGACNWPYQPGTDCGDTWTEMMETITALHLIAIDW